MYGHPVTHTYMSELYLFIRMMYIIVMIEIKLIVIQTLNKSVVLNIIPMTSGMADHGVEKNFQYQCATHKHKS
jgi:hypothetical protein